MIPLDTCASCRGPIAITDKIVQLWVVEYIRHGTPYIDSNAEAAHAKCSNPRLPLVHPAIPRSRLKPEVNVMPIAQKAPSHQCVFCGQMFRRGDRIVTVFQVEGQGRDETTGAPSIQCSMETEYGHHNCADRDQSKGPGSIILVSGS